MTAKSIHDGPVAPNSGESVAGDHSRRSQAQILLIEDDRQIAQLVATELQDVGYRVDWAAHGEEGLEKYEVGRPDLVVLDLNLPNIDGLEVCSRIRSKDSITPILMLTARTTRQDVVRGLELGADDYITKPFDTLEFVARVRALFRRQDAYRAKGKLEKAPEAIRCGVLSVDPVQRSVHLGTRSVMLTAKEFDLLLLFTRHPGRTFTRDELLSRVWGDGFEGFEHTVNTHINRLRNKIEANSKAPTLIETVWGIGYRLVAPGST